MADKAEVLKLLKNLSGVFGEIKVHPSVYCAVLSGSDASLFDAAYADLAANYRFGWPKPSDVKSAVERASTNRGVSFELCPSCGCKQYQIIGYGGGRYCMACHTEWEA